MPRVVSTWPEAVSRISLLFSGSSPHKPQILLFGVLRWTRYIIEFYLLLSLDLDAAIDSYRLHTGESIYEPLSYL
jgi:hypothetical protein